MDTPANPNTNSNPAEPNSVSSRDSTPKPADPPFHPLPPPIDSPTSPFSPLMPPPASTASKPTTVPTPTTPDIKPEITVPPAPVIKTDNPLPTPETSSLKPPEPPPLESNTQAPLPSATNHSTLPEPPSRDSVLSSPESSGSKFNPVYAGIVTRFFALIIDSVIISLILTIISFPFIYFFGLDKNFTKINPQDLQNIAQSYSVFVSSGIYVFFAVYSSLFISITGATPGKALLKMKVTDLEGGKIGFPTALLRELVGKWISGLVLDLGFLWAFFDKKHQAWHDKIAGTIVIKV